MAADGSGRERERIGVMPYIHRSVYTYIYTKPAKIKFAVRFVARASCVLSRRTSFVVVHVWCCMAHGRSLLCCRIVEFDKGAADPPPPPPLLSATCVNCELFPTSPRSAIRNAQSQRRSSVLVLYGGWEAALLVLWYRIIENGAAAQGPRSPLSLVMVN